MRADEEPLVRPLLSAPSPALRGVAAFALRDDEPLLSERRALLDDVAAFAPADPG